MNIHFLAPGHGVHIHNITYFFQNTQIMHHFYSLLNFPNSHNGNFCYFYHGYRC